MEDADKPREKRCETCCHAVHSWGTHYECRRHAPQVYTSTYTNPDIYASDVTRGKIMSSHGTRFPEVSADMWCGEWEAK